MKFSRIGIDNISEGETKMDIPYVFSSKPASISLKETKGFLVVENMTKDLYFECRISKKSGDSPDFITTLSLEDPSKASEAPKPKHAYDADVSKANDGLNYIELAAINAVNWCYQSIKDDPKVSQEQKDYLLNYMRRLLKASQA